jgi:predicted GIY-YIG superfamily endonuclease
MGNVCYNCYKVETPVKIFSDVGLDIKEVVHTYKVYVINCENNHFFVGVTTQSLKDEMEKHLNGNNPWTSQHKPLEITLHKSFSDCYDARVEETSKTLRLMSLKGIDNVRGGKYSSFLLNKFQTMSIKNDLAHNESLCFNCNEKGHYSKNCPLSLQYL